MVLVAATRMVRLVARCVEANLQWACAPTAARSATDVVAFIVDA